MKKNIRSHKNNRASGFTLIEMIVAVGVFAVAMLISVGAILSISAAQKRAIAIQNVQDNIRFALETMVKEARLGTQFRCSAIIDDLDTILNYANAPTPPTTPQDCSNGGPSFIFINARGDAVVSYQLKNNQIERWSDAPDNVFYPITSTNVTINELWFYVLGAENEGGGDGRQPRVIITARGSVSVKGQIINIDLQTMVSQRLLDS